MANWVADFLERNPDQAALAIAKRARHGLHFQQADGNVVAHFTGKPCHFRDTDGLWKPIDTTLKADGAEYGAPGVPVRIGKDGAVRIIGSDKATLHSQQTARVGVLNVNTRAFSLIKQLPQGKISGDQIIRETGLYRQVLTLTENGLREELVLLQAPPMGGTNEWLVLDTVLSGATFADGWLDDFTNAAMMFPMPHAEDSNGTPAPIRRYARTIGGVQHLFTGVPFEWLTNAKYPVTFDPDFSDSSSFGVIRGNDATYATARATSTLLLTTGYGALNLGQWTGYYIQRHYLKFDTSSITSANIVTQANLKLTATADGSDTDFDVVIKKQDWSGQDPLSSGNRETAYDGCLSASSDDNIWINTASVLLNTLVASGNLNTAWVNVSGNTYYSVLSSRDAAGNAPSGNEYVAVAVHDNATAGYRPVLTVVYTAVTGSPCLKKIFRPRTGDLNFMTKLGI